MSDAFCQIGVCKSRALDIIDFMKKIIEIIMLICVCALLACTSKEDKQNYTDGINDDNVCSLTAKEAQTKTQVKNSNTVSELKLNMMTLILPNGSSTEVPLWELGVRITESGIELDESTALTIVEGLASAHDIAAVDATAEYTNDPNNSCSFSDEKDGLAIDKEGFVNALIAAVNDGASSVVIPYETVNANVSREQLEMDNSLIAEFTTSFDTKAHRKKNRVYNIVKAAEMINGCVVEPNEKFSMNDTIGDRNEKNGWKEAAAISGGAYAQEYGGGVCQVSSTLFNAVLMCDMEIVERHHHSWPMSYVPIGRDATISTGKKDFIFRNTSEAPIRIIANVDTEALTITVRIYGRKSSEYDHIEISSEQTSRLASLDPVYYLDESLESGTKVIEREGRRGRTSRTYLEYYDASGELIRRVLAYEDRYPSIAEIAYVSSDIYYG